MCLSFFVKQGLKPVESEGALPSSNVGSLNVLFSSGDDDRCKLILDLIKHIAQGINNVETHQSFERCAPDSVRG